MNIDCSALKRKAKSLVTSTKPKAVYVGAVFLALSVIVVLLSDNVMSVNITEGDAQRYLGFLSEGNLEAMEKLIAKMAPPASSYFIYLLLQLVLTVVSVGFSIFLLNTVRSTEPCFGNLLDGFGMFLRIFVLAFLRGLIISLLMLLLFVPGIIMSYAYRQSVYLMIDHPEWSVTQCMKASREMMRGQKLRLFLLDLSLILYWFAGMLPYLGYVVQVYTTPFFGLVNVLYYEALRTGEQ